MTGEMLVVAFNMQTNQLWIAELPPPDAPTKAYAELNWVKISDNFAAGYDYVANDGPIFLLTTNCGAPKNRIVKVDMTHPGTSCSTTYCDIRGFLPALLAGRGLHRRRHRGR